MEEISCPVLYELNVRRVLSVRCAGRTKERKEVSGDGKI